MQTTVLIVDDHAGFRSMARRTLEADGYRVVGEAADGESGIEAAARLRPDLVLLDVQLPDLDGFAVARRITADTAEEDPPIVVLTSTREGSDLEPLVAASGARGFVAKDRLSGERLEALTG